MQPSILITGATGLLGSCCLPHLAARHGSGQIIGLVRPGRDVSPLLATRVETVEGDITKAGLGLSPNEQRRLSSSLRAIIHCAADIRFGIPLDASRHTNLTGTENLLRFAEHCTRIEKFAHMSTTYVSGGRTGHILETAKKPGAFFNTYQQSKFEAEEAVLRATRQIPASIYRFSTMIYNGASGRVDQYNYFHQLLRLALRNPLQMIPANPEAPIDLILSEWAARAFDFMFEEHFKPSEIVHICAGREGSLKVGELLDITFASLSAQTPPVMVDQRYFDQHLSSILTTASRRRMWHSLTQFLPHMNLVQTFDTAKLSLRSFGREDLQLPDMRLIFPRVLEFCAAENWGATY